jgi:DNA-binding MarR family transcriptional regulator
VTADPADEIAAALATLRGRRPRPPFGGGHGGPHPHEHPGHGAHPFHGGPPWGDPGQGRFAGVARLRMLDALVSASGPLSVSEIADAVGVDQPRASRLVQQGVQMHLVERETDPEDARRTRVRVTPEGERLVSGVRGRRRDAVRSALASFTDAERAEFARLLTKFADAWPQG